MNHVESAAKAVQYFAEQFSSQINSDTAQSSAQPDRPFELLLPALLFTDI